MLSIVRMQSNSLHRYSELVIAHIEMVEYVKVKDELSTMNFILHCRLLIVADHQQPKRAREASGILSIYNRSFLSSPHFVFSASVH